MEVAKDEVDNPIKQDTKKGDLRYIKYSPVLYNYGLFPQTWEDPAEVDPDVGQKGTGLNFFDIVSTLLTYFILGDDDPLDVIDIGFKRIERGTVTRVKLIGALALIDEGETDWKILVCNFEDPKATLINSPYFEPQYCSDLDLTLPLCCLVCLFRLGRLGSSKAWPSSCHS